MFSTTFYVFITFDSSSFNEFVFYHSVSGQKKSFSFSSTNNSKSNKFLSFSQSRFQLWRKMFGEAEASSLFFSFYFPFFQVSAPASGQISLSPFPFRLKNRVHISNSGTTGQLRQPANISMRGESGRGRPRRGERGKKHQKPGVLSEEARRSADTTVTESE